MDSAPSDRSLLHAEPSSEWLETDGLGGFASGTASGLRTRRYHGLLAAALTPPTGRRMLVSAIEAWFDTPAGSTALSSHRYGAGVTHPDGAQRIVEFRREPWPSWVYALADGRRVEHELFMVRGVPLVVLRWRLLGGRERSGATRLRVRPLLSGRDLHALQREDEARDARPDVARGRVSFASRVDPPRIVAHSDASYRHEPYWYRDFHYEEERARGFDHREDLHSPGEFAFDLAAGDAWLAFTVDALGSSGAQPEEGSSVARWLAGLREEELARRMRFANPLERAADAYIVRRGAGLSVIAGYPWFADWGRDAFIALRGLCLATGRLAEAGAILEQWAGLVSEGMLPNRFVEDGEAPEFNSVDASLWFAVAVREYLALARGSAGARRRSALLGAVERILTGYAAGTRFGIRADEDGLLACGAPGTQLTWMDARVDDREITPRVGKPVEVQALWIDALALGAGLDRRFGALRTKARTSFAARFWNEAAGELFDVVDVDHVPGRVDASSRPNQVLALGGLAECLLEPARARRVVDLVEARLWTPLGLRTLDREHPAYVGRYEGGPAARDGAYHQGTVWPWLLGPFVEAWVRVRGSTAEAKREARARFVAPLLAHLEYAGLGHVSEIADGDAPHAPRGAPFQAWSLGELLRLERVVLAGARSDRGPTSRRALLAEVEP